MEGIWQELSGAAGVAGLRESILQGAGFEGPVVCLASSGGLKEPAEGEIPTIGDGSGWDGLKRMLSRDYGLEL